MKQILSIVVLLTLLTLPTAVFASKPACYSSYGGYCQYVGKVKNVYINAQDTILIYFEEAMPVADAQIAGFTITNGGAGAIKISTNPEFAKMFYSTALTAVAQDKKITIQMRGNQSGYLKIDRIWFGNQ